jgi:thioesterase domain-containing protein
VWEKVLCHPAIGIRDNFFHLGGHSLLALRLIGEINRSLDTTFPVSAFAQNPTIEGMATVFMRDSYARGEPKLVSLKPGHSVGEIFFIGAGLAECRIAEHLDAGPASFATWVPLPSSVSSAVASGDGAFLPPLEELAAPHTSLILKHKPSGPCFLAGYSFHGVVAFEVAHQLRQQGRDVDMVLLVDSWAMNPVWWQKLTALPLSRAVSSLKSRTRRVIGKQEKKTAQLGVSGLGRGADPSVANSYPEINDMPWEVLRRISSHVLKRYRFRALESRAVLFRTLDDARSPYLAIDHTMGWNGRFTRGLKIVDLPGRHQTILEEPYIGVFARQFGDNLPRLPAATQVEKLRALSASAAK